MEWLTENWAVVTTVAGVVVALLNAYGKAKYAKVVQALVLAIEQAGTSATKTVAKANSETSDVNVLLAGIVKKLTEGG